MPMEHQLDDGSREPPRGTRNAGPYLIALATAVFVVAMLIAAYAIFA